jgi:hypothetical protein
MDRENHYLLYLTPGKIRVYLNGILKSTVESAEDLPLYATLEEIQEAEGNETVSLRLTTGRVRADVTPPAGGKTDFRVRSPSATASVRGTSFEFDGRRLAVAQGRVRFSGGDGTPVTVSAGHQVVTNPATGRTPTAVETVKVEMRPPAPVAVERVPTPVAAAPVTTGDFKVGTSW